ncbi:MAG: type VII toxin-antitoxin system MntA family adenylyltransferase antitoxin [Microgenomates group bacterium]
MEITKEQKKQIQKIGKKHHLDFIILHGSQVTGKKGPQPDVDVAIYRRGGIDFKEQMEIFFKLSEIFGEFGELDLKTLHKKDPLFRYYVVRDGKLLYGDQTDFNEYKAYAYKSYFDASDLFALEAFLVEKHQRQLMEHLNAGRKVYSPKN